MKQPGRSWLCCFIRAADKRFVVYMLRAPRATIAEAFCRARGTRRWQDARATRENAQPCYARIFNAAARVARLPDTLPADFRRYYFIEGRVYTFSPLHNLGLILQPLQPPIRCARRHLPRACAPFSLFHARYTIQCFSFAQAARNMIFMMQTHAAAVRLCARSRVATPPAPPENAAMAPSLFYVPPTSEAAEEEGATPAQKST